MVVLIVCTGNVPKETTRIYRNASIILLISKGLWEIENMLCEQNKNSSHYFLHWMHVIWHIGSAIASQFYQVYLFFFSFCKSLPFFFFLIGKDGPEPSYNPK